MVNNRLLELALKGLEAERERVESEMAAIRKQIAVPSRWANSSVAILSQAMPSIK